MSKVSLEDMCLHDKTGSDPVTSSYMALRDWAERNESPSITYEKALAILTSKGYSQKVSIFRLNNNTLIVIDSKIRFLMIVFMNMQA
jgi:hypothetical protein